MAISLDQAGQIWLDVMRNTPCEPSPLLALLERGPRPTYRERLDRPKVNYKGETIPQRALVERNIRLLGRPKQKPNLP